MTEESEKAESVFTVPNMIKTMVWLIPVVFGSGAIYASVGNTKDKVVDNTKSISEIKKSTSTADKRRALNRSQIKTLKTNQQVILTEVKEIRTEQRTLQQNMAALCQATGANCSR